MKAKKIEELLNEQELFDGEFTEQDKELYQAIFTDLSKEPEVNIPMNFADNIAAKVTAKATLWSDVKLYAFYSGLFLFLTGVCVVFFGFDTSTSGVKTQRFFIQNLPLIVLGAVTYFVIQTLDRVFVKGRIS
ncbi:MAG: hypothetical protein ACJA1O_003414 [Spirosomataceae bacterium]|jgi:hypothetical protein